MKSLNWVTLGVYFHSDVLSVCKIQRDKLVGAFSFDFVEQMMFFKVTKLNNGIF